MTTLLYTQYTPCSVKFNEVLFVAGKKNTCRFLVIIPVIIPSSQIDTLTSFRSGVYCIL